MDEFSEKLITQSGQSVGITPTKSAGRPRSRHIMSLDEFINETSEEERNLLYVFLSSAIIECIDKGIPVYLERLGILFPTLIERQRVKIVSNNSLQHTEKLKTIAFEKSLELDSYQSRVYKGVISTPELSSMIFRRLESSTNWNDKQVQRFIRTMIQGIKEDIIVHGGSEKIPAVGVFYALHNRQGASFNDWFAGADIFIDPHHRRTTEYTNQTMCERPIVKSSFEILHKEFGEPLFTYEFDVIKELYNFDTPKISLDEFRKKVAPEINSQDQFFQVAVFRRPTPNGDRKHLLFATQGVRLLGLRFSANNNSPIGTELTTQIEISSASPSIQDTPIEMIGARFLTIGWILLNMSSSKILKKGMGMVSPVPLFPKEIESPIAAVLCAKTYKATEEYMSLEGAFRFTNLVGITEDEANFSNKKSPEYLLTLLKYRKLDQVTRVTRPSILYNTSHEL